MTNSSNEVSPSSYNKHNLRMKKIIINTDLDLSDKNAVKVESKDVEVEDS